MMVVTNDGDDWIEYNEPNFQQACSFPGPAGKEISVGYFGKERSLYV